jgi:hypothetical protein
MPPVAERAQPVRPGAYGLHLPDLPAAAELLLEAPAEWIDWRVERAVGDGQPSEFVDARRARLRAEPDGWVELDRGRASARFHFPSPPADRELVHPYLAATAGVIARWQGHQCFHAGAFVADGRAWALLGAKGAGKSSLLAQLAALGAPILTDDVLVVRGAHGLAGPRCIDLRRSSAEVLGGGEPLGVVGTRERWRVPLGPVAPEVPLGGWIVLDWGDDGVDPLPASEALAAIFASFTLRLEPLDPTALMDLLALPALVVRQPQRIEALRGTAERLLERLAGKARKRS